MSSLPQYLISFAIIALSEIFFDMAERIKNKVLYVITLIALLTIMAFAANIYESNVIGVACAISAFRTIVRLVKWLKAKGNKS